MNRSQTDHLSVSPIPHSITEVDAINNNNNSRTVEANAMRKAGLLSVSPNQCKPEAQLKISPTRRQQQHQQQPPHHLQISRDQAYSSTIDTRLADWLTATNIDPISKNSILAEQFTYDDFIYGMEKTDLYRIGLR